METFKIFVSSPGDVAEERTLAERVIERLQGELAGRAVLEPVFWEHEPLLASASFQDQIIPPSQTDIVVSILWSRLGTRLPPGYTRDDGSRYESGTEFEFEDAVRGFRENGKPQLLVYRKTVEPFVSLKDKEALLERLRQRELLDGFVGRWFHDREEGTLTAAFHPFESSDEFEHLVELHLRKLLEARLPAVEAGEAPVEAVWRRGSPYRGLQTFGFEHAPVFFGRTRAVTEVLGALRQQAAEGRPFVLVLGMSGGGKSSLVRAGVLPMLVRPGVIEGVADWRRADFRPADTAGDLFDGLARALVRPEAFPELPADAAGLAELAGALRHSPRAVVPLIRSQLQSASREMMAVRPGMELPRPPVVRLALLVDQMEEIFTREEITAEHREAFLDALAALARSGEVWILATLRSDFYPRCAEHETLVALKEGAGQYDLLPPSAAEIQQMIQLPTRAAGLRFERDPENGRTLDDALLDAAVKNPEALPLLEFALDELYQRRTEDGVLTFEAYDELGGLEGALAQRAEEVFAGLPEPVREALPRVLNALVSVGREGESNIARRRARWERVIHDETRRFLEAFVEARLFVTELDDDGQAVVGVAHESLLWQWPRVESWLLENRDFLRVRQRVAEAAAYWQSEGALAELLLPEGKPLAEAEDLLAKHRDELQPETVGYVEASLAAAQRRREAERLEVEREIRRNRRIAAAFGVLSLLAAAGLLWALWQRSQTREQLERAKQNLAAMVEVITVSDPANARGRIETPADLLAEQAAKAEELLSGVPLDQAKVLGSFGEVLTALGEYERAGPWLDKALELRSEQLGDGDPLVAESLTALANLHYAQGRYEEAEPMYRRALEIREEALGAEAPEVANSLNNLAAVAAQQGDHPAAEGYLTRAIEIGEKVLPPEDPERVGRLKNLAALYLDQRDFDKAEWRYKQALELQREVLGEDHPSVAVTLVQLGELYYYQQKDAEAQSYYHDALELQERVLGSEHADTAGTLYLLASLAYEEERDEEAERLFQRTLDIQQRVLPPDSPALARTFNALGLLYYTLGRDLEAEESFRRALEIREKRPGDPDLRNTLESLAELLRETGRPDEARELEARYGVDSPPQPGG